MEYSNIVNQNMLSDEQMCFVISPIGKKESENFVLFKEVLDYLIKPAVNNSGYKLHVLRADEIDKSGSIIREILYNIKNSFIVIADLTNQNPNVFYELGVRHSLNTRTILIAQDEKFIPFDLRDYRTIIYDMSTAKGIRQFEIKLKKYIKEIYENPLRPDNPVLEKLKKKEITESIVYDFDELEIQRRRNLSNAMQGIPHPLVINSIANHLAYPDPEIDSIFNLEKNLSSTFFLKSHSFVFRQNTTQAFRDALESVLFHEIFHKSREGEEGLKISRLFKSDLSPFSVKVGKLLYSDLDHPAMDHMAKQIWPIELIANKIILSDIIFNNNDDNDYLNKIIDKYLMAIKNNDILVVLIPHVIWINGAVLNIKKICKEIRSKFPHVITIIDGAQAIGHININIEHIESENTDIDFYLGCGHKWLCGPETVGFCRVGQRFRENCKQCQQFLATSDLVSDIVGLSSGYKGLQIGTNQRGIAKGLTKAIQLLKERKNGILGVYNDIFNNAEKLRNIINSFPTLEIIGPPQNMRSGIVSFIIKGNDQTKFQRLKNKLRENKFSPVTYEISVFINENFGGQPFFRLSPGPDLTEQDFECLLNIFEEVL